MCLIPNQPVPGLLHLHHRLQLSLETKAVIHFVLLYKHLTCIYPFNKILSVQQSVVNCRRNLVQQISRIYSSCITETLYLLNSNSLFPSPPRFWQLPFYSQLLRISLTILYFSCKWNHRVFILDWLISLSVMPLRFIPVVVYGRISFFRSDYYYTHIPHFLC